MDSDDDMFYWNPQLPAESKDSLAHEQQREENERRARENVAFVGIDPSSNSNNNSSSSSQQQHQKQGLPIEDIRSGSNFANAFGVGGGRGQTFSRGGRSNDSPGRGNDAVTRTSSRGYGHKRTSHAAIVKSMRSANKKSRATATSSQARSRKTTTTNDALSGDQQNHLSSDRAPTTLARIPPRLSRAEQLSKKHISQRRDLIQKHLDEVKALNDKHAAEENEMMQRQWAEGKELL